MMLLLAQNVKITYWLTPVWILSVGIAIGFLLAIIAVIKIIGLQKICALNSIAAAPGKLWVAGLGLSAIYVVLLLLFITWFSGGTLDLTHPDTILAIGFGLPVCLLAGFGAWHLVSKRLTGEIGELVNEGFLKWMNRVCIAFSIFAVLGLILAWGDGFGVVKFVDQPGDMLKSLMRVPFVGTTEQQLQLEPSPKNFAGESIAVQFDGRELRTISFISDQPLEFSPQPIDANNDQILSVEPSNEARGYRNRIDGLGMFKHETYDKIYVSNLGNASANVNLKLTTEPAYSEVNVIPVVAISTLGVYLLYLLLSATFPKIAAIALSTFKTEISQPIFILLVAVTGLFLLASIYVPYNTFGEDIKMYKDSGLNLIRVVAIFTAIWAASKSVAEEIEGRTALTVLSKPVGRRQFILGKFSGISLSIGLLFLLLGLWFMIWVAYKPVYDGQENSTNVTDFSLSFAAAFNVVPGLVLCFLESVIFVAISVAISTRLGSLPNFLICFAIYVIGHLTPLLVQSSLGSFETIVVFAQLVAVIFPVLDHFDIQAAISNDAAVPLSYLAWATIYTALYGTIAMLVALVLFEDRDLA